MPPQTDQEQSNPDFGFMLDQQQPAHNPPGPAGKFTGFGKPFKILAALAVVFVVVIVAALIFSGGGSGSSQQVLDLMAQNQEIIRVSQAQDQKFTDGDTKGLAATTRSVLSSQKIDLGNYLAKSHVKYGEKELAVKTNPKTDSDLETAAQNNNLDDAYAIYLRSSLTAYSSSLSSTFKSTDSASLKQTLKSAFDSVQTILDSPQFRG
ncbi:MAG TPA: hypothetical protein VFW52_01700 [Candidatus Saccharimonadales bacterium]|nr:hypothetical protein [Candidatus Saccharimonadales bacterium]